MKTIVLVSALAAGIAIVCATSLQAAPPTAPAGYADGVYADYVQASGQKIAFELKTMSSGNMKQLEGKSFADLLGAPHYLVDAEEDRLSLRNIRFKDDLGAYDRGELDAGVEGFDVVGLPVEMGSYRKLAVRVSIDGKTRRHEALEMCWEKLEHCVVFDPNIVFLDSIVNNRRLAKAVGYRPQIQQEQRAQPSDEIGIQAVCGLASNPNYIAKWLTWGSWTQRYKNVYGMTLVTKNLGGQQAGIRCNSSCYPAPFGYSNASSGSGTLGYNVDCGNAFNSGTTGRTGRWVAETKCAHKFSGTAKADVSRNGSGASVSLAWDTNGGIDSNGGRFTDTCGYF